MASRMPDAAHEGADEASANRDLWTQVSTDYTDEHAFRAWAASEITSRALCRLACGNSRVIGRLSLA
jgi:hypothetical protein